MLGETIIRKEREDYVRSIMIFIESPSDKGPYWLDLTTPLLPDNCVSVLNINLDCDTKDRLELARKTLVKKYVDLNP